MRNFASKDGHFFYYSGKDMPKDMKLDNILAMLTPAQQNYYRPFATSKLGLPHPTDDNNEDLWREVLAMYLNDLGIAGILDKTFIDTFISKDGWQSFLPDMPNKSTDKKLGIQVMKELAFLARAATPESASWTPVKLNESRGIAKDILTGLLEREDKKSWYKTEEKELGIADTAGKEGGITPNSAWAAIQKNTEQSAKVLQNGEKLVAETTAETLVADITNHVSKDLGEAVSPATQKIIAGVVVAVLEELGKEDVETRDLIQKTFKSKVSPPPHR